MYSCEVKKNAIQRKDVEEARRELSAILDAASQGRTTIITRRGADIAAVVPARNAREANPLSLLAVAGSGKGLWGRDSARTVARLRDEGTR